MMGNHVLGNGIQSKVFIVNLQSRGNGYKERMKSQSQSERNKQQQYTGDVNNDAWHENFSSHRKHLSFMMVTSDYAKSLCGGDSERAFPVGTSLANVTDSQDLAGSVNRQLNDIDLNGIW